MKQLSPGRRDQPDVELAADHRLGEDTAKATRQPTAAEAAGWQNPR
ncbi:hypothetical protein [Rhizobium sp. RCC_161_2]